MWNLITRPFGWLMIRLYNMTGSYGWAIILFALVVNLILTLSPERIILGGGVMHQLQLFDLIRAEVKKQLNDYVITPLLQNMYHYIVPASLHDDQGIMGCIKLAIDAGSET